MSDDLITCENIQTYLQRFSLVYACDMVKDGTLRIATPFTYPNGSHIDLFLRPVPNLFEPFILTDYGQTADYLSEIGFSLWGTKKRRIIAEDVCASLGIRPNSGALEVKIPKEAVNDLSGYIIRLAQACIRITDLSFTQRLQTYDTFENEVEEFIALKELSYEVAPDDLIGVYDKPVKVDFRVQGLRSKSLVQTWSKANPNTAHLVSNEIFVRWHDLQNYKSAYQFITVYDDTAPTTREDDFARLYEASTVIAFPTDREAFAEILAN